MSKEEAAVRKALAAAEADTGVQQAQAILSGASSAQATPAPEKYLILILVLHLVRKQQKYLVKHNHMLIKLNQ